MTLGKLFILASLALGVCAVGCGPKEDNPKIETLSGDAAKSVHLRGPQGAGGGGGAPAPGTASPD